MSPKANPHRQFIHDRLVTTQLGEVVDKGMQMGRVVIAATIDVLDVLDIELLGGRLQQTAQQAGELATRLTGVIRNHD